METPKLHKYGRMPGADKPVVVRVPKRTELPIGVMKRKEKPNFWRSSGQRAG